MGNEIEGRGMAGAGEEEQLKLKDMDGWDQYADFGVGCLCKLCGGSGFLWPNLIHISALFGC